MPPALEKKKPQEDSGLSIAKKNTDFRKKKTLVGMEKKADPRIGKTSISLGKKSDLKALMVGLGWDPVDPPSGGFLSGLFGKKAPQAIDLDASLIVFDRHKIHIDSIWMRKLRGMDGMIRHSGDSLDGDGGGDNEKILINLEKLSEEAVHLVVTVSSFNGQGFNVVKNAHLRIIDLVTKKVIHNVTLAGSGPHTGMVMAVISRSEDGWRIRNIGSPIIGRSIIEISESAQSHL
jgi:tellurium resistance protein TerZ